MPKRQPKDGRRVALGGQNGAQGAPREALWRQRIMKKFISVNFVANCDLMEIMDST